MNEKLAHRRYHQTADANGQRQATDWYRRMAAVRTTLVVLYSLLVIYFGTRRQLDFPGSGMLSHDKLLHALVFGGLGVLAYRCGRSLLPKWHGNRVAVASVAFATLLGAALEVIQACLPYRSMEFTDLVSDLVGAMLCVVLAKRLGWERPLLRTGS